MGIPANAIDFARVRRLLDLIEESGQGEIRFYVADSQKPDTGQYVHIEITGRRQEAQSVKDVFQLPVLELLK